MSIVPYSTERMSLLKQLLLNNAEAGKPSDYEIRVDDLKVVSRTSDPDQFDNYEEFVTGETRRVIVLIYDGTSRRNTRHTFILKEEDRNSRNEEKGLSGVELDNVITQKLDEQKRQWKQELLEKENKELKKKVEDAEEYIDELQTLIANLKSKRGAEEIEWGKMLGIAAGEMIKNNPKLVAKVPLLGTLAGTPEKDTANEAKEEELNASPKAEASFKRKETEDENETEPLSEIEQQRLHFFEVLDSNFDEDELNSLVDLMNSLIDKPKALQPTLTFCKQWKEPQKVSSAIQAEQSEEKKEQNESDSNEEENAEENLSEKLL
jgi:hypothetical protein